MPRPSARPAVDAGMFVTGSHDCSVCVWDTNAAEVVASFQLPKKVSRATETLRSWKTLWLAFETHGSCFGDTWVMFCELVTGAPNHRAV
jgi:hypothetical protein